MYSCYDLSQGKDSGYRKIFRSGMEGTGIICWRVKVTELKGGVSTGFKIKLKIKIIILMEFGKGVRGQI